MPVLLVQLATGVGQYPEAPLFPEACRPLIEAGDASGIVALLDRQAPCRVERERMSVELKSRGTPSPQATSDSDSKKYDPKGLVELADVADLNWPLQVKPT